LLISELTDNKKKKNPLNEEGRGQTYYMYKGMKSETEFQFSVVSVKVMKGLSIGWKELI